MNNTQLIKDAVDKLNEINKEVGVLPDKIKLNDCFEEDETGVIHFNFGNGFIGIMSKNQLRSILEENNGNT